MEPSQAPKKDRKHRVMGSVLSVICMAAILASTLPATPVFAAEDPLTISETDQVAVKASATATTTDRLNLRAGAGSSYEVLTVLELGAQVTVLDDSNAESVKVRTGSGQEGYCSREYLNMGVEAASSTLSLNTKSYTNTAGKSYRFLAKVSGGSGAAPAGNVFQYGSGDGKLCRKRQPRIFVRHQDSGSRQCDHYGQCGWENSYASSDGNRREQWRQLFQCLFDPGYQKLYEHSGKKLSVLGKGKRRQWSGAHGNVFQYRSGNGKLRWKRQPRIFVRHQDSGSRQCDHHG